MNRRDFMSFLAALSSDEKMVYLDFAARRGIHVTSDFAYRGEVIAVELSPRSTEYGYA